MYKSGKGNKSASCSAFAVCKPPALISSYDPNQAEGCSSRDNTRGADASCPELRKVCLAAGANKATFSKRNQDGKASPRGFTSAFGLLAAVAVFYDTSGTDLGTAAELFHRTLVGTAHTHQLRTAFTAISLVGLHRRGACGADLLLGRV